jgi:hypothetical protein
MPTIPIAPRADNEGSIGKSLRRWSEGHFVDLYLSGILSNGTSNVSATSAIDTLTNLSGLTADEAAQLLNIDSTVISSGQWAYLGSLNASTEIFDQLKFIDSSTINFTVVAGTSVTADLIPTAIDHNLLTNYIANEHIDHSTVNIIAGTALTGGGDITSDVTLNVDLASIDHDLLLNFVANEHIDHSAVSITTGTGLTGGGDLTTSRTIEIDPTLISSFLHQSSTGRFDGGTITIGAGGPGVATTFNVAAGFGQIIDNFTDVNNPTQTVVNWNTQSAIAITNFAAEGTHIFINAAGNVVQVAVGQDIEDDKRDNIYLGVIGHPNNSTIQNIFNLSTHLLNPHNQFYDFTDSIGPFSFQGNVITANGANQKLDKSVGKSFLANGNSNEKTPHTLSTIALVGATIGTVTQNNAYIAGSQGGVAADECPTTLYDAGGAPTNIPGANNWVTPRIWHAPILNVLIYQYSQFTYSTEADALAEFDKEAFVEPAVLPYGAYIVAVLVHQDGETNFQNNATIIPQGKFRSTSGGGLSVTSLQGAYNNSAAPEILTDATRGAITVQRGSVADTDNIFEGLNGAGTQTFAVQGDGIISTGTWQGNTILAAYLDNHDNLTGFVSNEHIDHSTISLIAGTGISATGLGDLTASRTINVDPSGIDHNALLNFVSNQHIDHSAVTLTAGIGLSGGGNITASRTIDLDIDSLTEDLTPDTTADFVATYDTSGLTHKKVKLQNLSAASAGALTENITVGENVVSGDLIYLKNDGKYWKADNTAEATASTDLRLATATISANNIGSSLIYGPYTTTGLVTGDLYYVGVTGGITNTQPTADGEIVRIIGTARSTTELIFSPDETYFELTTAPLRVDLSIRNISTADTFTDTDYTLNCTTGTFTVNLPTAVGRVGRIYVLKNSGTGIITLDADTTETIDGSLTLTLKRDDAFTVQSDGANWIII